MSHRTYSEFVDAVNLELAKVALPKIAASKASDKREDRYVFDCWRLGYSIVAAFRDVKRARKECATGMSNN